MTGSMEIGQTVPDGSTEKWKDKKRYLWLLGLMVPGLGITAVVAWLYTDWVWLLLAGPILVNLLIPVLDLAFGLDPSNPPDDVMEELENDKYYRWVVYAYIPLQFVILFAGFAIAFLLVKAVPPFVDWALVDAVWSGPSTACRAACAATRSADPGRGTPT